jgi:hypothetical protein
MRHLFIGLALLTGGLLSACSTVGPRTVSDVWPLYRPSEFTRASGGRDTYVVLRGNPFAMATPQFEQLVLDNMQGQNAGPRTNFTTRPTNYDPATKVVMLFNGANQVNGSDLCRNPGAAPVRSGPQQELHVLAVYCQYDSYRTKVDGWLKADASGVSPDGFAQLVRQVTRELFPLYNPNDARRDHDDRCRGPNC